MKDFTILGFVEHLVIIQTEIVVAEHEGLDRAAEIIQAEAKDSLGEYQQDAPPFAGWAELADSTKQDRVRQGYPEDEPELRTGEMRDSIERTVEGREAEVGSDSEVLEFQELGTSKMPPRSILGGAAVRKGPEVAEEIGERYVAALIGERVFNKALPLR